MAFYNHRDNDAFEQRILMHCQAAFVMHWCVILRYCSVGQVCAITHCDTKHFLALLDVLLIRPDGVRNAKGISSTIWTRLKLRD